MTLIFKIFLTAVAVTALIGAGVGIGAGCTNLALQASVCAFLFFTGFLFISAFLLGLLLKGLRGFISLSRGSVLFIKRLS
jgi:hypothetical protein